MRPSKFTFLLMLLGSLALAVSASIVNADIEVLHHFSGAPGDGAAPNGSLLADGEVLYGVTSAGGQYDKGTLFSIQTDGSNYSSRYSFSAASGAGPRDFLVKDHSFLYGTTFSSGGGYGTVFKVRPSGGDFQVMHIFVGTANDDGQQSLGGLFRDEEKLYGMTIFGGSFNKGTVFRINKNDFGYEIMHSFSGEDGGQPQAALVGEGGTLYGTSALGGRLTTTEPFSRSRTVATASRSCTLSASTRKTAEPQRLPRCWSAPSSMGPPGPAGCWRGVSRGREFSIE